MNEAWIEPLASELRQKKYRTLCEAELIDIIRRYARSGHVQGVSALDGTICCRTDEETGDGIVTIRFPHSKVAYEFAERLESNP